MEYFDVVRTRKKNFSRISTLRELYAQLNELESILSKSKDYLSEFEGIESQLEALLGNATTSDYKVLIKLAEELSRKDSLLLSRLNELESVSNFPTDEVRLNFINHIRFLKKEMRVEDIDGALRKSEALLDKLNSERKRIEKELELRRLEEIRLERERKERLERERLARIEQEKRERERLEAERIAQLEAERKKKRERNKKIAKYVGIALAIGVAIWLVIAFVIPFILAWWWAILIAVVVIGFIASKM